MISIWWSKLRKNKYSEIQEHKEKRVKALHKKEREEGDNKTKRISQYAKEWVKTMEWRNWQHSVEGDKGARTWLSMHSIKVTHRGDGSTPLHSNHRPPLLQLPAYNTNQRGHDHTSLRWRENTHTPTSETKRNLHVHFPPWILSACRWPDLCVDGSMLRYV